MTDDMDRRDYLRLGTTASAILLGGGIAAKPGWEWYSDRDNRIDAAKLEEQVEKKNVNGFGYWGNVRDTAFNPDSISASITATGEQTAKGGREFTAHIKSRKDPAFGKTDDFIYYAGNTAAQQELADALFESHEVLFDFLYDTTGDHRATDRRPEEDRIVTYTTVVADDTAATRATIDAETADQIAQGGFLQPTDDFNPSNNKYERQRFQDTYNKAFTLANHSPSRINTADAERTVEKQLQAANQDAYERIIVGGITASLEPADDSDTPATYTATVTAPIGSWSDIDICRYIDDERETELAGDLANDMEKLFTSVYNQLSQYVTQVRGPKQDDITTYRLMTTDDSGQAQAGIDADTATWIARGNDKPGTYKPENSEEHARFRQAYFDAFTAACGKD